ncbi:rab-GTPase-TBC domain-containing protein [Zychaea mexicana]|uniref:rab-GTPase-TBC domain-containing protein n=1 Tax=Zychaea mexicana TaxID=64656 RepID=UPI0022FEA72E|nr:rab-GTPase-TBC domain-containing protein [Zychaea mexicana]KAI9488055.1 rab-GTPase-TBC domain-containing protein [Zychaea mexicana]
MFAENSAKSEQAVLGNSLRVRFPLCLNLPNTLYPKRNRMTDVAQSRRRGWHTIFDDPNLSTESIRHRGIVGAVCQSGLRSVCWKIYTGYFPSLELSTWADSQAEHRQHYSKLKQTFIEEPAEMIKQSNSNQDLTDNNPLALNDNNPWQQYFEDSEIRKTIRQDVDRTFPDVEFFRNSDVQEKMTDVLFIYCKLNEDVSYRQGMHELLAPFYWVLTHESWPKDADPSEPADKLIAQTLDSAFIEHDAYVLFDKIMKYAKPWYEFNERISTKSQGDLRNNIPKSANTKLNPVVLSCQRIHHKYLRSTDPVLYEHLERFNIEPQLYGMRWLRLLFGREFEFHELLKLWDAMFATDPSLQIAEYVCLTILLRMHDQLLASDYAECLTLLMRAPQVGNPTSLVEQAKYLQNDLSEGGGLHVLQQNDLRQGKPPRHSLWEGIQQQQEMHQTMSPNRIAHRRSHANLDNLASITRGVMKSPQVRDLNRAIAGVMGTVQKNVNMFGDNVRNSLDATPSSSRRRLTVSSEFPSDIDRHFTAANNRPTVVRSEPAAPPRLASARPSSQPPQAQDLEQQQQQPQNVIEKIAAANRQMADVLAKSIDVLETELFMGQSTTSTERHDGEKTQEKQEPDQAVLISALTGIKHIRDVLSGKQSFDLDALSAAYVTTPAPTDAEPTTTAISSSNKVPPIDDVATVGSKDDKDWEIVTDDGDKQTTTSSASEHLETKPWPPLQQSNNNMSSVEHHATTTTTATTATTSARSTSSTMPSDTTTGTGATAAKQSVVYRIEDLISDPTLQRKDSDTSNSNKFKWILQNNDDENEFSSNNNNNRRRQQFKPSSPDTARMPPLRTTNTSYNKRTPTASLSASDLTNMMASPSAIDPLGAKSNE